MQRQVSNSVYLGAATARVDRGGVCGGTRAGRGGVSPGARAGWFTAFACALMLMVAGAAAGCGGTSAPRRTPAKEPVSNVKPVQAIELARGGLLCDGKVVIDKVGVAGGVVSVTFRNSSSGKVRLECALAFYDGAGHEVRNGLVDWRRLELEPQRSAVLEWELPRANVVATRLLARAGK